MKDIGLKLIMPTADVLNEVSKNKELKINGCFLKNGTKIRLRIFDKEIIGSLFFDDEKKMLLFKEKQKDIGFNILGYIYHITEIDDKIVDVL